MWSMHPLRLCHPVEGFASPAEECKRKEAEKHSPKDEGGPPATAILARNPAIKKPPGTPRECSIAQSNAVAIHSRIGKRPEGWASRQLHKPTRSNPSLQQGAHDSAWRSPLLLQRYRTPPDQARLQPGHFGIAFGAGIGEQLDRPPLGEPGQHHTRRADIADPPWCAGQIVCILSSIG